MATRNPGRKYESDVCPRHTNDCVVKISDSKNGKREAMKECDTVKLSGWKKVKGGYLENHGIKLVESQSEMFPEIAL